MGLIGDLERFFGEYVFPLRVPIAIGLGLVLLALAVLAWRRRWDRPIRRHPGRALAIAVPLLLVLVPAGWVLGSPLIIRSELVEADPIVASSPGASPVLLAGEFVGADEFHFGSGQARIVETDDGFVLRFEDFSVLNGPDLHVYLSPSPDGYAEDAVDLGALRATDGSFNVDLPAELDLDAVASVVIWCEPFAVQFAHAALGSP